MTGTTTVTMKEVADCMEELGKSAEGLSAKWSSFTVQWGVVPYVERSELQAAFSGATTSHKDRVVLRLLNRMTDSEYDEILERNLGEVQLLRVASGEC